MTDPLLNEYDYDDYLERCDEEDLARAVTCDACGDLQRGRDLHACPSCGDVVCERCSERMDDLFLGWCKWCVKGDKL